MRGNLHGMESGLNKYDDGRRLNPNREGVAAALRFSESVE